MLKLCNLRSQQKPSPSQVPSMTRASLWPNELQVAMSSTLLPIQSQGSNNLWIQQRASMLKRAMPSNSLFNRLESFVHQLGESRDFFALWPERICRRMRQEDSIPSPNRLTLNKQQATLTTTTSTTTSGNIQPQQQANIKYNPNPSLIVANRSQIAAQTNTDVCWNGIDFTG